MVVLTPKNSINTPKMIQFHYKLIHLTLKLFFLCNLSQYFEVLGFEGFNYNKYKVNEVMFVCEFIFYLCIFYF